jgi:DNA-3-methyladenine glycosylase II
MDGKAAALRHFARVDPIFYNATKAHHASLPNSLQGKRTRDRLFESLTSTVISQQLGMAAARSILARIKEACGGAITIESIRRIRPSQLRSAGLSGAKVKTLKAITTAVSGKTLDLLALKKIPESDAAEVLMRIWGLGPWSVEMFMMFGLGREDVFSAGDLGIVRSMENIYGLPKNTKREKLSDIASTWSPYRTYACLLLWRSRDAVSNKKSDF